MKDNNSLGKTGFIIDHLLWGFINWIWYKNILFRCLGTYSFLESKLILYGIIVISCITGILFEIKRERNEINIFFNLAIGYGIYTVLTYIEIRRKFIIIILSIITMISIVSVFYIMCRKIKKIKCYKKIFHRRTIQAVFAVHRVMGLGLAIIIAASGGNIFFCSSIMQSTVKPAAQSNLNDQSLSNNMETIVFLKEDKWRPLTVQEKLNILQTAANVEQNFLGLSTELNVGTANLDDDCLGYYSDETHEIIINMDLLVNGSPSEVLLCLCHEVYHSYQHRLVEAYNEASECSKNLKIFYKANSYVNEFAEYINGEEDFCGYYDQECESDARDYAKEAVSDYYRQIDEYLRE